MDINEQLIKEVVEKLSKCKSEIGKGILDKKK
jgi:hypothetical protein